MLLTKLLQQGQLLRRKDRSAAMDCFQQCIETAEANSDRGVLISALTELAFSMTELGQTATLQRAKNLLLRAEALLIECDGSEQRAAYLLYCHGILYFRQRNFVDSLVHLRSAYRAYEKDLIGLSHTDDALGLYYSALGDFQAALFHLERSLTRRQKHNHEEDLGISHTYLGQLHLQMGQNEQAEQHFQQALALAQKWEYRYIQIQALSGLGRIAIEREHWQEGLQSLQTALEISQNPTDLVNSIYLRLSIAEVLLGQKLYATAQNQVENEIIPHFQALNDHIGLAIAQRTLGKILSHRLRDRIDCLTEESIEVAEDYFFDASMVFEQYSMPQEYAKTLYDLACLYKACLGSTQRYQYQGKAVRALELALSILEKVNYGAPSLIFQIEVLLNQIDQAVWLERAMTRLRNRNLLAESKSATGQVEEVGLLFVELHDPDALVKHLDADEVMQLIHLYLRCMTEVIQKYKGVIAYNTGDGLMVVFRSPNHPTSTFHLSSDLGIEAKSSTKEQVNLHPALRATLTAQEMRMRMQTVNEELHERGLPSQAIRIGVNSGSVTIGDIETFNKVEFMAIGSAVNSTAHLCRAAAAGQIRISESVYTLLRRLLSAQAVGVTKISENLPSSGEILTYALNELSYYAEPTNKPAWLLHAEFPAIIRLSLSVQTELEEVAIQTIMTIARKLGFSYMQGRNLIDAIREIYREVLIQAIDQPEILLLFLPEESKLEVLVGLESLETSEVQSLKDAFVRMQNRQGLNNLTRMRESYIETTSNSLTVRLVQCY